MLLCLDITGGVRSVALLLAASCAGCGGDGQQPPHATFPGEAWPLPKADESRLRFRLDQEEVRLVFQALQDGTEFDAFSYHRRTPNQSLPYRWSEHPEGSFRIVTNGSGLRNDEEILRDAPGLRVLVTGDSHTDGVCTNAESYSGRLAASLASAWPGGSVEVLNAGVGRFSFYNYLGVLQKFLPLEPDVFVVGVFGGNDFLEVLAPRHYLEGTRRPQGAALYKDLIHSAKAVRSGHGLPAVNQAFNQLIYLETNPDQVLVALEAAQRVMLEIQRICAANDIRLVVLYIPPPHDVEPERHAGLFEAVATALELEQGTLRLCDTMADSLLDELRSEGAAIVDGRELLSGQPEGMYWRKDHHINLAAHSRIAEGLHRSLLPMLR